MLAYIVWAILALILLAVVVAGYYVFLTLRISADAERRVPERGKSVKIGGDHIHYIDEGDGRAILFIHGLGGQLHHFRHPLFGVLGGDYRLVALDRPGSGYSIRATSGPRLHEQARLVAEFIDALGLDRPLLVGHSLGGAIALATALDHPEKVSGLALIAPLTHLVASVPAEFGGLYIKSPLMRRIISHTTAVPLSLKYARQTLEFVFGPQSAPADYMTAGGGYLGLRPSHFYATSSDLVALRDDLGRQQERYGELQVPVSILYGDSDRVLDHRLHGVPMTDKVNGLTLDILPGVGHMVQYSDPAAVSAFIRQAADRSFTA